MLYLQWVVVHVVVLLYIILAKNMCDSRTDFGSNGFSFHALADILYSVQCTVICFPIVVLIINLSVRVQHNILHTRRPAALVGTFHKIVEDAARTPRVDQSPANDGLQHCVRRRDHTAPSRHARVRQRGHPLLDVLAGTHTGAQAGAERRS